MPVHVHPDVHPLYQSHMQPGHVQCAYICGQCALVQPLISSWETRVHFCCRWTWRGCFSSWRAGGWRPRWVTTRGLVTSIKLNCNWAKEDAGRGWWVGECCMNAGDLCSRATARRRRCTHSAVALSWEWVTSRCNVQRCAAASALAMCVQSGQILVVQAFILALWQTLHTMGTYPSILKYSEHGSTFTWIQNISCMCKQLGSVPYDFCILPHAISFFIGQCNLLFATDCLLKQGWSCCIHVSAFHQVEFLSEHKYVELVSGSGYIASAA